MENSTEKPKKAKRHWFSQKTGKENTENSTGAVNEPKTDDVQENRTVKDCAPESLPSVTENSDNNRAEKQQNKTKKNKGKKSRRPFIAGGISAFVFIIVIAFIFLRPSRRTAAASYRQTLVQTGTITKTVVGSGSLSHGDKANINIPDSITVKKILVSSGDYVEEGQSLAEVDMASVQTALADVRSRLDELDDRINSTSSSSQSNVITSNYSGRVKKIYAKTGKEATDIMLEYGSVMLISIDGKMAVDFETTASLSVGDSITVKLSDGTGKTGTVISHTGSKYTATVTDNGTDIDETVTLLKSGTTIGSGKLYINKPITVAGSGGTIEKIHVSENGRISVGTKLITLEDSVESTEYLELQSQREELMEQYTALVSMSKNGEIVAPQNGTISTVNISAGTVGSDSSSSAGTSSQEQTAVSSQSSGQQQSSSESESSTSSDSSSSVTAFTLATDEEMTLEITVDEMDILSVNKGMEVSVTFDAVEDKTYTGTISRISNSANSSSGSAKYTAEILLTSDENMRAGMNATATITIEKKENVLTLPVDAIQERGSRIFVYTLLDGETPGGETEITTGISDGQTAEILSGLSEGQTVYYTVASSDSSESAAGFMMGGMQGGNMERGEMPGDSARPSGAPGGGQQ